MTFDLRTIVWKSLLTAGMNKRYWSYTARRYSKIEQVGNVFLAATSSTTVAIWKQVEWLWQLTSVIPAVISLALPILGYSRLIEWLKPEHPFTAISPKSDVHANHNES